MEQQFPILTRRRIEANILKHVYDTIRRRSGEDEARAVIGAAVSSAAIQQGAELAAELKGDAGGAPNLQDFFDILPLWTRDGALEIDVLRQDAGVLDFNVLRCRYAEMYREMGLGDIGHLLSCNRDGDFCIGFNQKIELQRTQTIMQGASHCDFRYRLNTSAED